MNDFNSLDRRLQNISWAFFLIMIGGLWIVPQDKLPKGTWMVGVGIIMLGLNLARYINKIKVSRFTTILGILGVILGVSSFYGLNLPLVPLVVILIGINILIDATKK